MGMFFFGGGGGGGREREEEDWWGGRKRDGRGKEGSRDAGLLVFFRQQRMRGALSVCDLMSDSWEGTTCLTFSNLSLPLIQLH